jgi:putative SOS response-associated peptidase YedK
VCGRYVVAKTADQLWDDYDIGVMGDALPEPSWNIKPTQSIPIIVESALGTDAVQRRLEAARWSLIPTWVKDGKPKFSTFNARSEDAATKASWKTSVTSQRCVIPADGYYEWVTRGTTKTPHYIDGVDKLTFAGLYSWWRASEHDPWMLTATILTMATVPELAQVHDRTPVTLPESAWAQWLDPHTVGDQSLVDWAVSEARPVASQLTHYEVAPLKGDGAALIEPLATS